MSDIGNIDLSHFNFDDGGDRLYESPLECLKDAYLSVKFNGSIGDSFDYIGDGLTQFPDNVDLLAFMVIHDIKFYNLLKAKGRVREDYVYQDTYADRLLSLSRNYFTIHAYSACLCYLLFTNPEGNEELCRELVAEMEMKFPYDICSEIAEPLIDYKTGEWILTPENDFYKEASIAYEGLKMASTFGDDHYSDYITSVLPLFEMLLDRFSF